MTDKDKKIRQFLSGDLSLEKLKESENGFIYAYRKVINNSNKEKTPEFDPFEKIETQKTITRKHLVKKWILIAASLFIIIGIGSVIFFSREKTEKVQLNSQQIAEIEKNAQYALSYFSRELNRSLGNLKNIDQINKPTEELKKLKDIKIEYNNPIKNLKIDKL